uniref:Uncharacterized protein LOC111131073 isoform X4 n=1 Tax=Crassostrea virginica TaxID=6565 RepID=A0A8B8E2Y1_CRAVI|nr:uncharacterized protein LOC111131073 isoform X4 [Crassostrea virginica]
MPCNSTTDRECSDYELSKYLYSNPDALWDMFPCPPPWKPLLILELPWKERLGEEDGDRLCKRLASRCGLDLAKLQAEALQSSLIFSDCDIKCFIGLLIGILVTVCLLVAMVTYFKRRRKRPSKVPDSKRETRVYLTTCGVQTQLLNGEDSPPEKKENWIRDLSRLLRRTNTYESHEPKRHRGDKSEDESRTCSGADTSNTCDSARASDVSYSYRMSDPSARNQHLSEEIMLELREKYNLKNSEMSGFQSRNVSSPVSNLLYDVRSPNSPVSNALYQCSCQYQTSSQSPNQIPRTCQCNICSKSNSPIASQSSNQIPRTCQCNICNQSNSSISYRGYIDKQENRFQPHAYPSSSQYHPDHSLGFCRSEHFDFENFPYVDDKIYSGVQNHSQTYMDQENAPLPMSSCNCKQCVQQNMPRSDDNYSAYSTGSDVYGVPQTAMNYPREIQCNCRQCTRMIPIAAYTKRLSNTGDSAQRDEIDTNLAPAEESQNNGPEHRKRRRSKPRPPVSSTASSSDNAGSEKSFRSGKMKTNGSLFNSKLINR